MQLKKIASSEESLAPPQRCPDVEDDLLTRSMSFPPTPAGSVEETEEGEDSRNLNGNHSLGSISSLPPFSTFSSTADLLRSRSVPSVSNQQANSFPNYAAARQVLETLAKFQTCLFMLSNTVVRLHENLKLIIPSGGNGGCTDNGGENANNAVAVQAPGNVLAGVVRRVSTCPNLGNVKEKGDIILDVPETSSKNGFVKRFQARIKKYAGIILALFASICMSLVTLIVKLMEGYHPVSKVIWRLQGVLLPSVLILVYVKFCQKREIWNNTEENIGGSSSKQQEEMGSRSKSLTWKWKIVILLVARGVVGCLADIFQYYSLKYLSLADSTVISFSTPIFVCIVAHFVLKEKCGIVPIFTAILTLIGVIVICKPPILTGAHELSHAVVLGNILAVLCMMSATITTVLMRYLQNLHFGVTMLALGVFGTVEGFLVTIFTSPFEIPGWSNGTDWILVVLIAGLFFLGQLAMTLALQREEAGVVSLVRTCDVLFAFLWQVYFLHQNANVFSYVGALIVTMGVIITALRKWVGDLPENSRFRRYLSFILR